MVKNFFNFAGEKIVNLKDKASGYIEKVKENWK